MIKSRIAPFCLVLFGVFAVTACGGDLTDGLQGEVPGNGDVFKGVESNMNAVLCSSLDDVKGNPYELEICALVDAGYWKLPVNASSSFNPNADVIVSDEIMTILNILGHGEEASTFVGGVCPDNPYVSYAVSKNIIKAAVCPAASKRRMVNVALDSGRALWSSGDKNFDHFNKLVKNYDGPSLGEYVSPYGISEKYFKFLHETNALIGFDNSFEINDTSYGKKILNRAEAAAVIYHALEVGGRDETIAVPEHVDYLAYAQKLSILPDDYNVNAPMSKGEFLGMAVRLMRQEGCIDYESEGEENPFTNVPDDYEFLPELIAAAGLRVIKPASSSPDGAKWSFNHYNLALPRMLGISWLNVLLARTNQCKISCKQIWREHYGETQFSAADPFAVNNPIATACAYHLGALPLAIIDDYGIVNPDLDGIPEAEESLVTLFKMLQFEIPEETQPEPVPEPDPIFNPYISPDAWISNADGILGNNEEDHDQASDIYIVNINSACLLSKDLFIAGVIANGVGHINMSSVMTQLEEIARQAGEALQREVSLTERDVICLDSDFDGQRDWGSYGHNYYGIYGSVLHSPGGNYGDNCRLVFNPSQASLAPSTGIGSACDIVDLPETGTQIIPEYLPLNSDTPQPGPTPEPTPEPDPAPQPEPVPSGLNTYYVRPGGGTAAQCSGLVDADYTDNIANRSCAFSNPMIALPPSGTPVLKGGDTLIIAPGQYRIGYGAPGAEACSAAYPWDCTMSRVPSGPDAGHPTRILGVNTDGQCLSPPELFGVERAYSVINLNGSSNIEISCFEITDHADCVEFHSGGIACRRSSYPFGEWAATGIVASDSSNVLLKNLNIHGLANSGILAGRISDWTVEGTVIRANGWSGWNGDIIGNDSNSGTIKFRNSTIEWNGCGESYPAGEPIACWGQSAGGYGDGLGVGSTGGNWIFEHVQFLHNTSDGLDLLYHNQGGKIILDGVHSEGNAGDQVKVMGETEIKNSIIVGNCGFFAEKSFTYNVDNCRALGNTMSLVFHSAADISIVNSTIHGGGDCLMIVQSPDGLCGRISAYNNIYIGALDFLQPWENSAFLWTSCPNLQFDSSHNIIFNVKNGTSSMASNSIFQDPMLTGFENGIFNAMPKQGSPAIDGGMFYDGLVPDLDFFGNPRPVGSHNDIGAIEVR